MPVSGLSSSGETAVAVPSLPDVASADIAYGNASGNGASDLIELGSGEDTAYGEAGKDRIAEGSGKDLLVGGTADDLVVGDAGSDRLFGGSGADRLFAARKVVSGGPRPHTSGEFDGRDQVGCGPRSGPGVRQPLGPQAQL